MINKLNKIAIAMMVAGATAIVPSALAGHVTNTFTNAVQTLTIDLKLYTNSPDGHNKVVNFTTKNLILALSNDTAILPTFSNAPAAAFTKNPNIVVSTTYGAALVPSSTNASSTNTMTNVVSTTNVNFVAVAVSTNIISLSASNAVATNLMFASTTSGFPTNGTDLMVGAASNVVGAIISNSIVVVTNVTTVTNSFVVGTNTTYITNNVTNEMLATNLVLIVTTNGWAVTNIVTSNNVLTNSATNLEIAYVGTNGAGNATGATNLYTALTNTPGTNLNLFVTVSSSNYVTTNFGFGTNTTVTNLTFVTMSNTTSTVSVTNTTTNFTYVTNYTTNFTTSVSVTDVGLEIEGGPSTNYSYIPLDSLLGYQVLQSVIISSNATSEVEYQAAKFTLGAFGTNAGASNVSLTLHGFVNLASKDDVLSTSHGVKTEVGDDTYTAAVSGYGYIGGSYSTNPYVSTNSASFQLPTTSTDVGTNGSIVGATPVVVEGTISLGAPKNIPEH